MNVDTLATFVALVWRFAVVSLFAVGGGVSTLIPMLHDETVRELHWLDDRGFAESVAVAQAAPGPNFMLVPVIAWHVAGIGGAVVALLAFLAIPVTIAFCAGRLLRRHENPTIVLVRRSFRAVTAGMWIASATVIVHTAGRGLSTLAIAVAIAAVSLFVEISPLWWCVGAGVLGALLG